MRAKINRGRVYVECVFQQVVKLGPAGVHLQAVDTPKTPIIRDHQRDLDAHHASRCKFRIRHHIAAIAQHTDYIAGGLGHFDANGPGNFIPHAGKPIFHVVRHRTGRFPQLVEFARHGASGRHDHSIRARGALHGPHDLHIGWHLVAVFGRVGQRIDFCKPIGL